MWAQETHRVLKLISCLGKMYLLPKIHKRLYNVSGRSVISNCGTPTEKASEFLDYHSQPVMISGKSYVKDTGDLLEKIKSLGKIPENFENRLESLKGWFQNRGYPKTLVDNQLKRVTETRQTSDQTYKRGNGVLLVLTYHPRLKNINDIIKKHLVSLYAKEQV